MLYLFLRHDAFSFVVSADELSAGLFFLARLRARKYLFMAKAASPPVDAAPAASIAAVARQNGHMCTSSSTATALTAYFPAPRPERMVSDCLRTRSNMCAQPCVMPDLCSSETNPSAVWRKVISVPPSFSLRRYCKLLSTGADMKSGPASSINVGRLIACT